MAKTIKSFNLVEKSVLTLAQKDLAAYQAGNKSYELNNWLKDELVIQAYLNGFKELQFQTSCKAFQRITTLLGYFVESQIVKDLSFKILDRESITATYRVDLDELPNAYRRYLNQTYSGICEIPMAIDEDNLEDIDRIEHSFA
jgi:hypothetical protein